MYIVRREESDVSLTGNKNSAAFAVELKRETTLFIV